MDTFAIIQPRHIYAPPSEGGSVGQVYFPSSAYFAAARLRGIGYECHVYDENIAPWDGFGEAVGLACIGSPYMEPIATRLDALREAGACNLWVGGQGVRGLGSIEFSTIFGSDVLQFIEAPSFSKSRDLINSLPAQEDVSIERDIEALSNEAFERYFRNESPLYISQGCRFSCTFCGAERARTSKIAGPKIRKQEKYRNLEGIHRELCKIAERSIALGITNNSFYLSNLDLFQSQEKLADFLDVLDSILKKFSGHRFIFRGLSTSTSFIQAYKKNPDLIRRFVDLGLAQVGFGIDGATPEVWKAIRKPHASDNCLEAVAVAREVFSLTPEVLMVFGHEGHDNANSLSLAVDTVRMLTEEYGAIPRPHVAKGLVPGNDGWYSDKYKNQRQFLIENPWAFQFLDFTCLPTDLTHSDPEFRKAVSFAFLEICKMPNCLTQHVLPQDRRLSPEIYNEAILFNKGRFDI